MRPPLSQDERGPGSFAPDFPSEVFLAEAREPEPLMLGLLLEELDLSAQPFDFSIDVLLGPLGHRPFLPARRDLLYNEATLASSDEFPVNSWLTSENAVKRKFAEVPFQAHGYMDE
jgi:hypothetical protein